MSTTTNIQPPNHESAILQFCDVTRTFRARELVVAVNKVSFSIAAGEFIALQGPSGSGKTTLLLMAGMLLRPDSGQILLAGHDTSTLSAEQQAALRRSAVGFVFQQFHLVPYLTLLDNVRLPFLLTGENATAAREVTVSLGLEHRLDHYPSQLSAGERQRTALARALATRPQLLLADEPTGNLDDENAALVAAAIENFTREGGSALVATHDLRLTAKITRRLTMRTGQFFIL